MLGLCLLRNPSLRLMTTLNMKLHSQIKSCQFEKVLTPELQTLSGLFDKYGYEIRIAGGAVRDLLMGKDPSDVDLATTATPDQMKEMFNKEEVRMINSKGEEHGTITARIHDKENFEVTTLRIDKVTDGRHASVEFTRDWQLDANRRDLTINSMFLGLDGTLYDFFSGADDLAERRVRFVGEPAARIQEDYLRILRYFRFFGRIAPSSEGHEEETLTAIRNNVSGMSRISGERIWTEWKKILVGNHGGELTELMVNLGLAPYIGLPTNPNLPELRKVWSRNSKLEAPTLLASLLTDQTDGLGLHSRLKLSGLERDLMLFVIQHRLETRESDHILRHYQWLAVDSKFKTADTRLYIDQVLKYRGELDLASQFSGWEIPRFPVTGNHLKEAGCPPGKIMSVVLDLLKQQWKESDFQMGMEILVEKIPAVLDSLDPETIEKLSSKGPKKRKISK